MTSILSQLKGVFNEPIQMQLSPNQKTFSQFFFFFIFFLPFLNLREIWHTFLKKDESWRLFVSEFKGYKNRGYLNPRKAAYQNTYRQTTC